MAIDTLIKSNAMGNYLTFVATHMGRDKVMRCLQYWGRFYTWYLLRTNGSKEQLKPWEKMRDQFTLVRKVLRFGRFIESFRSAVVMSKNKVEDPVYRTLMAGRHVAFALYLCFDSATLVDALGIRALKPETGKRFSREMNRFWAIGLLCSALAQAYRLMLLNERASTIDKKEADGIIEYKKMVSERTEARTQIICDLFDVTSPAAFLGWAKFDEGLIGLTGIFSSLISVSSQWTRLAE